jgi:RNA polymerase-binding transcription factor DksA
MVQSSLAFSRRQYPGGNRRLIRHLPALRVELEQQRDFRNEQLAHLLDHNENRASLAGYGPRADGDAARALDEVRAMVTAGARQALADIELALARMNDGTYGRCRACDAGIPLAVLTAIPTTTLCRACHPAAAGAVSTAPGKSIDGQPKSD